MKHIDLSSYKSLWKTKKALNNVNPSDWEDIIVYYRPKTHKLASNMSWKNLADAVFSEYCRLYYADSEGMVKCITSGQKMPRWKSQCGHFISRAVLKYRYDILNCYPQSYQDNVVLGGNYKVYTMRMIDMLGREKTEEMLNDKETVEYNQSWYESHIQERYKFIVYKKNEIEKNSSDKNHSDLEGLEF